MKIMGYILSIIILITIAGCNTEPVKIEHQANLNLLCREVSKKSIQFNKDSDDLQIYTISDAKENGDIHRFKGNKLYITDQSRAAGEYLYNTVYTIEDFPDGFKSGHMTIAFNSDYTHAVVTHAGPVSSDIYTIKCSKTADK